MENTSNNIPSTYRKMFRLENLEDYKVHHDDVDIREFKVQTVDGDFIGEVENLLVDKVDKIVRYVEIELEESVPTVNLGKVGTYTEKDGDRTVIVPVGYVNIDEDNNMIRVNGLKADHFRQYPRYAKSLDLTPEYESSVYNYWSANNVRPVGEAGDASIDTTDMKDDLFSDKFYNSPYFSRRNYRKSATQTTMTKNI